MVGCSAVLQMLCKVHRNATSRVARLSRPPLSSQRGILHFACAGGVQGIARRRADDENAKRAELAELLGGTHVTRMRLLGTLSLLESEDAELSEETKKLLEERADALTYELMDAKRARLLESAGDRTERLSQIRLLRASLRMSDAEIQLEASDSTRASAVAGVRLAIGPCCLFAQCREVLLSWKPRKSTTVVFNPGEVCEACGSVHNRLVRSRLTWPRS